MAREVTPGEAAGLPRRQQRQYPTKEGRFSLDSIFQTQSFHPGNLDLLISSWSLSVLVCDQEALPPQVFCFRQTRIMVMVTGCLDMCVLGTLRHLQAPCVLCTPTTSHDGKPAWMLERGGGTQKELRSSHRGQALSLQPSQL